MLKRINVTWETWDDISLLLDVLIKDTIKSYGNSTGTLPIAEDGLAQVPITNKEWASWVGYEHEEQTLWFSHALHKSPSGFLVKQYYGAKSIIPLTKAVVWNAGLYIHFTGGKLAPRSIRNAILQSLQYDSSCPDVLWESVAGLSEKLCKTILAIVCDADGHINRCGLQILKDNLDAPLGPRNCTNRALRRNACLQLIAMGLGTLGTRIRQNNCIVRFLKGMPNLKGSAIKAIERLLLTDKELLRMNGGVSLLLPYTEKEKHLIYTDVQRLRRKSSVETRIARIKEKVSMGQALTDAERKFKHRHKEMFEQ
jgi:hypothetical protein